MIEQTYLRRVRIVNENSHRDTEIWNRIKEIVRDLGVPGMSEDETETEASLDVPKTVRRSRVPWINPEISNILHAVDSYNLAAIKESLSVPKGNQMLNRLIESRHEKTSRAVANLPRNFYDDGWFQARTQTEKCLLGAGMDVPIPKLVSNSLRLSFTL